MSDQGKPNKIVIAFGILAIAIGTIPLWAALGVLPAAQHAASDPAPSWMGWLIGLMFGGAGISVVMRGIMGGASDSSGELAASAPSWLRAAHELLGIAIVCSLAVLFTWIAFGPGVRHFSVSAGGLSMPTSGAGDTMGRVAFGFGSVLIWCIAGAIAVTTLRRWQRRRQ